MDSGPAHRPEFATVENATFRPSIRVLRWRAGGYDEVAYVEGDQPLAVTEPFPVTVVPADLIRV